MRARIVGRRYVHTHRRGNARCVQCGWMHWYATVVDERGRVLWADDCRDLATLADQARVVAKAFDCVASRGQTEFRTWADIVDEAGEDL